VCHRIGQHAEGKTGAAGGSGFGLNQTSKGRHHAGLCRYKFQI